MPRDSVVRRIQALSWILTIWAVGSALIYALARALGADVTFAQTLGVIGYCLLPLVIAVAAAPITAASPMLASGVRIVAVAWATYSAGSLLASDVLQRRASLLFYPILLLYICASCVAGAGVPVGAHALTPAIVPDFNSIYSGV